MYRYSARAQVRPHLPVFVQRSSHTDVFCRGCDRGLPIRNGYHYDPLGKYKTSRCYRHKPVLHTHSPTPRIYNSKHVDPGELRRAQRRLTYRVREPGESGPALPYLKRKIDLLQDKPEFVTVGCFKVEV